MTRSDDTDAAWESWGRSNPYWAVLTQDRFQKPNLDAAARVDFFSSGEEYIEWVFATMREKVSDAFAPKRALDFGCGVGRLLMPLARRCEDAVGVDVSESMLHEAKAAAGAAGIRNVDFVQSDDSLSKIQGRFDFVNSSIVFQHIPCHRGLQLFRRLVDLLSEDGFGSLQLTYAKKNVVVSDAKSASWPSEDGFWYHLCGLRRAIRRRIDRRRRFGGGNRSHSHRVDLPVMQMNSYTLNPLFSHLQQAGVRQIHVAFTDHEGTLGTTLFFQKQSRPNAVV